MLKHNQDAIPFYENLLDKQDQLIQQSKQKISKYGKLRIALALAEVLFFVALLNSASTLAVSFWALILFLGVLVFVWVVKRQIKQSDLLSFQERLLWVIENERAVLSGKGNGYDAGDCFEDEKHPFASDLDVFGKHSLFELINRSTSRLGNELLAEHLVGPLDKTRILERQQAIEELKNQLISSLDFRAIMRGVEPHSIDHTKQKLSGNLAQQLTFASASWLQIYVKIVPFLSLAGVFMAILMGGKWSAVLGIYVLINVGLTYFFAKPINLVYHGFGGASMALERFAKAIAWIEEINWQSTYIRRKVSDKQKVGKAFADLSKIITAFDARLNFLLNAVLNFFLLWDLRCSIRLFHWQKNVGHSVADGLDSIGFLEELLSFATLRHNYPECVFPTIQDDFNLTFTALGHPLIAANHRVVNDFYFAKVPSVDIVTGSNMAGKSTFLRTLGVNLILAYAGSPVCAKQASCSVFNLLSYMRIKDNLIENTSTFKAELNRLKMILDRVQNQDNTLVLIDEMLRGTNSKDKFDGSKAFIQKMLGLNVPLLFATHDLQLSELEAEHPNKLRNFHFDIQLNQGEMDFDYKIKSGPCTQFNAAFLLQEIGLSLR
jgi:hypothetical protein